MALLCFVLGAFVPAATAAIPPAPGGPILVITSNANAFGGYYAEILRNEGLNAFDVASLSSVTPAMLAAHDVAILGDASLSAAQVTMLGDWVGAGGNLIASRPDPQLAPLLGLTPATGTLSDAYLKAAASTGITTATMQFHGTADRWTPSGATSLATLYSDASTATANPAVTVHDVGANGGQAAAFTYDLARSVVYTRQGNPSWINDERDGTAPLRSDDLFYGAKAGDVQPDWVDLNKVAIPQADEQQRLLANLIGDMNADRSPLPRFWYLPRGEKAAVVMTGDDHAGGGTAGRFDHYAAQSTPGCSVADWECVRGTSYVYPNTSVPGAAGYEAQGFELALHVNTGCNDAVLPGYQTTVTDQLADFAAAFPGISAPVTNRNHCIAWGGWIDPAIAERDHGMRLDTNYYFWPPAWVQDRPGMFTGSGFPMRFADTGGTLVDVYQAATQMTDESGQNLPATIAALLDKATGAEGYYGAFTANMHTDSASHAGSDAIVASAQAHHVPVVSAKQMLTWLDGRNSSSFGAIDFTGGTLSFTVAPGAGADGLQAMVPVESAAGTLTGIERNGSPVSSAPRTVKGVAYAFVGATAGSYEATYTPAPPAPTGLTDTTTTHFGAGSGDVTVTDLTGGELTLNPGIAEAFDGVSLPAGWTSGSWTAGGGATIAGGALTADGGWAATTGYYPAGRTLEFDATFGAQPFQHVGFGVDLDNDANWAMFSTGSDGAQLYARTNGPAATNTPLGAFLNGSHHFRIEWNTLNVRFFIDGNLVATHNVAISTPMRPIASDFALGGPAVSVESLTMTPPNAGSGTFISRVLDAGAAVDWDALSWTGDLPAGTSVALEVRTGPTSSPDGSWSAFAPVAASGDAIGAHTRYLQYRATLATTDPSVTAVLRDVTATYGDHSAPQTTIGSGPSGASTDHSPAFTFSADEPGSTFACSLDGAPFTACTSPRSYSGLADGPHTFRVRATDAANNTDATPASRSFTLGTPDTTAPDTMIESGPSGTIAATSAAFAFSADEPGSTFACSLDGAPFTACTSPQSHSGLADGPHTFRVRATDAATNADATPASRSFTVATGGGSGPDITIDRPWQGARYSHYSNPKTAHNAQYACPGAVTCTAEVDGTAVADGAPFPRPNPSPSASVAQTFTVTATDALGHTSTKSVTYRVYTFRTLIEDLSPLAYWRLNDGFGASAMHALAGPDGEYKNGQDSEPWGISGDGDASRHFTGADGYAYVNGVTAPRRYTMSVFFNIDQDDTPAMIMQHGGAGAIWYDGDKLHFRPVDWDSVELTSPDLGAQKWHHVAATFGSGTARLFLDGELVDEARSSKDPSGTSTLYLGYGDKAPWLRGGLDEAAYFPTVLDVDQINQIWLADPPPTSHGPATPAAAPAAVAATPAPARAASGSTGRTARATVVRSAVRNGRLVATLRCAESCSGTLVASARIGGRTIRLGTRAFTVRGSKQVSIALSTRARRKLAGARHPRIVLKVR